MSLQKIVTPGGETLVVLPLADYEALIDAADIAAGIRAREAIAAGREELVPAELVDRILAGESPIRVWREHRGLTGAQLAQSAGLSAGYLSELENGKKAGGVDSLRRLAEVLVLSVDDLL